MAFINLAFYLHILRYSATHATADIFSLKIKSIIATLVLSAIVTGLIYSGPEVGVESTLTCGVKYDKNFSQYTELAENWELLLVPYMIYKCFTLTKNLPGFIEQSFSYYAL